MADQSERGPVDGDRDESVEAHADELFGRVEELEGYFRRMSDSLQEDYDDAEAFAVLVAILVEAGFHA